MHGGVKFYRGSAAAARSYVEADHSRADDYYLAEGSGVAEHYAVVVSDGGVAAERPAYERWVAGYDVATGRAKGRLRVDDHALRFVEVVVNGPKTWSLAAARHPDVAAAYEASRRSKASVTPPSCATRGSRTCSPRTATRSTKPARSSSSRRTPDGSASVLRRSPATSTATKPSGERTIPVRNRGRSCDARGTDARGRTRVLTRSCLPAVPSWWRVGTTSCSISGSDRRSSPDSSPRPPSAGSDATSPSI